MPIMQKCIRHPQLILPTGYSVRYLQSGYRSFKMNSQVVLFFLNIALVSSSLNIKETSEKIKYILSKYRNSDLRYKRNSANKTTVFVQNTLHFFEETERFDDFLKYLNVSECSDGYKNNTRYVKRHIYHGLLINPDVPETHWEEFKSVFEKRYLVPQDERTALRHWRRNLQHVARHNRAYLTGKHSYSLHVNHFGDLPLSQYVSRFLKLIETVPLHDPAEDRLRTAYVTALHHRVPRTVDWRAAGFRPRREMQLGCGACYAFAVTHALQAQLYKKHRDWRELSPQQIVDCSGLDGNKACDGGSIRAAMRYVAREGLMMERHYPYLGRKGFCHHAHIFPRVRPRRWAMLPAHDEAAMERALATIGPLAVAVNASPRTFALYRSGIYDDPFCTPWRLNHAMLLVGYTPRYWVLLNWWGRHWGEDGYMRIRRGLNRCGVANMAAYVEL